MGRVEIVKTGNTFSVFDNGVFVFESKSKKQAEKKARKLKIGNRIDDAVFFAAAFS